VEESATWYQIANIQTIDTPALVVYPERVKENIRLLKSMVRGVEWLRPHVKTHKMAEVVQLMLEEGIFKFKCATIAEAEMLAMAGAADVLLAYQPVGPKIERLKRLVSAYPATRFSCLIDNLQAAEAINKLFASSRQALPVFLDLNVGMNRTGIKPGSAALEVYRVAKALAGVEPVGLHAYDGHHRESDFNLRKERADAGFEQVTALAEQIEAAGLGKPVLVAGGSPTFPVHAQRPGVECSPGTFIFWDWGYQTLLPEQKFKLAALVVTRVISKMDDETLCLDLGHKSVAAENPFPRVHFLNGPDARPVSQSEEHLVVKVNPHREYGFGHVFYGAPVHICPTCALYEQAYPVENGQATGSWKVVSRNRFITI
jgi:D-serine deaminase-like pyridoxal phosphate-dependent protein